MIEKQIVVDLIEIVENGCVQVRTCTRIIEDGEQLSNSFYRHVVVPGADYSAEDAKVQAVCAVVHTADVIAAYQEQIAQQTQIPA
jgi:hypothetical protein